MTLSDLIQYFPLMIGFFTLVIGSLAILKPQMMSKNFGVIAKEEALPYVIATGARDVFIGLVVLIFFFLQMKQGLALCHLTIGLVALSDFLVVRKFGDKKTAWVHLFGAVAVVAYGTWILYS